MPSDFSFNQILVYHGDEDNVTVEELKTRFALFDIVLYVRLYRHHIDEYYGSVTFDNLQTAAKAATAVLRRDMVFDGMPYRGKISSRSERKP